MASPQMVMFDEEAQQIQAICDRLAREANAKAILCIDKNGQPFASAGEAQRRREDGRLSESGRRRLADEFNSQARTLCAPHCWDRAQPARTAFAKDHERLANEIYRLAELDRLFDFVAYPEVPGTNNASEQLLRGAAQSRKLARTSKSDCGCRRRSVITSVMESLRKHLGTLTMQAAAEAMKQWLTNGHSVFAKQLTEARRLQKLNFSPG